MFDELVESCAVKKKTNKGGQSSLHLCSGGSSGRPGFDSSDLHASLAQGDARDPVTAPPPPPPPPPPPTEAPKVIKPVARLLSQGKLTQPRAIPKAGRGLQGSGTAAGGPPSAREAFWAVSIAAGLLGGLGCWRALSRRPRHRLPSRLTRIKLGGQVQAAKIIAQPQPRILALARQARIQGNVVLHAIIDKDGRVGELQVVSGHPLLVQAALEAVKNWRYQPTQLNGDPVEVDTTITVTFVLGG